MPNEILIMIMDSLPAIHVLNSFFCVNKRYHQIIRRYMHQINLADVDPHIKEYSCSTLLPAIRLNIESLILDDIETFQKILSFNSKTITQLFPYLRHFEIVKCFDVNRLSKCSIQSLRLLFSLKLEITNLKSDAEFRDLLFCDESRIEILNMKCNGSIVQLQDQQQDSSRTLRKLTLTLQNYNDFLYLLNYMPALEYLDVKAHNINDGEDLNLITSNKFHYLTEFHFILTKMTMYFNRINSLLSLFYKLERLSLNIMCFECQQYIDGYYLIVCSLTRKLLGRKSRFFPKLKNLIDFEFYLLSITSSDIIIMNPTTAYVIETFQSEYWLKTGWKIGCFVNPVRDGLRFECHVFSLPFKYERFSFMPDTFLNYKKNYLTVMACCNWINVRFLFLHDVNHRQYSVEFFKLIEKEFINLKTLFMNKDCSLNDQLIHDRRLTLNTVNVLAVDDENMSKDFGKRMLLMVPNIKILIICSRNLMEITNNFSDQDLRTICSNILKVGHSDDNGNLIQSKEYFEYFPNLLK
ncbi:unnamed protein product [Didymodactylos carnosus]|uniref:F-box domain-containing protein n=1 Tax=Didymodactylos carnosus TaxID=1234261 RepID=A0A815MYH8_9BILA|nr:unnamed protein product [Didymodactylos carnosus]CAF4307164.1 unnamed protein product [Didymodactylos carnosus]